jgi:hypothetical protein
VLDSGGKPLEEGKVAMLQKDLTAFFKRFMSARLVMEVGGQSPWVSRLAHDAGLEVIVANPRRVQLAGRTPSCTAPKRGASTGANGSQRNRVGACVPRTNTAGHDRPTITNSL